MDPYRFRCINLLRFFLPLFCLLSWSWGVSSTSASLAADTLRNRGYSLFASVIVSLSSTANFSGTLLVPPDFAFSFATAKFLNNPRPPPRPSISLLLYHTLKPPFILTWPALSSRNDGDELRTLYNNNCLYLFKSSYGGEVSISSSPFNNPMLAVKIRQPDLYVDEYLTVHGIDGVLDPSFATKCSVPDVYLTVDGGSHQVSPILLDRAIRTLRRKGYNVVAAAMAIRRWELLSLTSVTVFSVSDENLFLKPSGFRFDFRHHVVPLRLRIADLAKLMADGTELDTLAPNKTVVVDSIEGSVNVNGVAVDVTEVYRNRWIVVLSIMTSLDDIDDSYLNQPSTGAVSDDSTPPSPFSGASVSDNLPKIESPAPSYFGENTNGIPSLAPVHNPNGLIDVNSVGSPSPGPDLDVGFFDDAPSVISSSSSPSLAPEMEAWQYSISSPANSPAPERYDFSDPHCDFNSVFPVGVEGGDLLCPVGTARQVRESEISNGVHVERGKPLDAYSREFTDDLAQSYKVKIAENVNIADDIFFYI